MKEYKVLTQKDRFFGSKFDPTKIESALNLYANEGWELCTAATAQFPALGMGKREEIILILERDKA